MVAEALGGKGGCLFVYGGKGTGKSGALWGKTPIQPPPVKGTPQSPVPQPGTAQLALKEIFEKLNPVLTKEEEKKTPATLSRSMTAAPSGLVVGAMKKVEKSQGLEYAGRKAIVSMSCLKVLTSFWIRT